MSIGAQRANSHLQRLSLPWELEFAARHPALALLNFAAKCVRHPPLHCVVVVPVVAAWPARRPLMQWSSVSCLDPSLLTLSMS